MIHVDFASFEEMVTFARQLLGESGSMKQEKIPEGNKVHTSLVPSEDLPGQAARGAVAAVPTAPVSISNSVAQVPSASTTTDVQVPVTPPVSTAVPTSAKEYTADELAQAAIPLLDAGIGGQKALMDLLARFGVQGIPQLPREQYGAFATALRGLGAKI